ncbi:vomeronasal type-2 receptor 116-like isoform X2, partial [Sigmodon hispidus]
ILADMRKLCAFIICFLFLKISLTLCSLTEPSCFWRIKHSEEDYGGLRNDCNLLLLEGGCTFSGTFDFLLLSFRNSIIPTWKYEFILILLFATNEINKNPYILPNTSLKFGFDNRMCLDSIRIIDLVNSLKNGSLRDPNYYCGEDACDVVLRGPSWTTSVKLSIVEITPKIFFGPFQPVLSENVLFPYVNQIAQNIACLPHAIVSLMLYFSWTWIGLVTSDDYQGMQFLSDLRDEIDRNGVCLAFVNIIPDSIQLLMNMAVIYDKKIMISSANVVLIYGEMNSTLEVIFRRWQYLGIQRIWVTTSQWDVITRKRNFSLDPFHGTITCAHHN